MSTGKSYHEPQSPIMKNLPIKSDYQTLIYEFRGYKVMLDFNLAALYDVETKRLKEQVRRNISRFPKDFMFELNKDELDILRSQFATSSHRQFNRKKLTPLIPLSFQERGKPKAAVSSFKIDN
jgi:hypothetical protein